MSFLLIVAHTTLQVHSTGGVYNEVRLLRFLQANEMDVQEAYREVVVNSNVRLEFKMDEKRQRIVAEDLCCNTIPRQAELLKYFPHNNFLGRTTDGLFVDYCTYGKGRC